MNKYRTHKCNELRKNDVDKIVSLSGWINKKRDHGNLLFIDLRERSSSARLPSSHQRLALPVVHCAAGFSSSINNGIIGAAVCDAAKSAA